ncbi:TetR/AcrR family transcriptional regulator C-terminal domain-containing protein [Entomospira culicis]|uniref:TetR family transcriptional regulator n=1 Tax=Entomospira culicis TaxID=2719989 RepID=A0A968GFU9_9SPIO|nr:TetR/AcrR family transcriptional regulator C-terminal domain-containing protein [Entomospira culicis]NIZ19053.1 TetR family transcriptional regulator [Entomospira culicis]NIZ69268.1 TetR family transcriptional regulator [Entomospira culicis]WDI37851.1 TetR/AcrR family transcriptional regulator C-terminal domain-containing protein [Entomospira culicis]WDI39479.1 TetR/AcrR family transcriptional regulator C-terminal domain-containing protein [Entomospira culicis]
MKKEELSLRTKEELALSLKILMQKKEFKKITVTDLITECNISRPTFYYHFKDIYALMRWAFEYNILTAVRQSSHTESWKVGLTLFLEHIKENRPFVMIVYQSLGMDTLHQIFSGDVSRVINNVVRKLIDASRYSPKQHQFLVDFYSHAIMASIMHWVFTDMQNSVEEMIQLLELALESPHLV